ncbi:hypothetical protein KY284_036170 [Solanum tuberosum]|nr:hypothetical protein KY284_036170 [Solanum tuberosum]
MANMAADQPSSSAGQACFLFSKKSFLILKHPTAHRNNSLIITSTVLPSDPMSLPNEKKGKEVLPVKYVDTINKDHLVSHH